MSTLLFRKSLNFCKSLKINTLSTSNNLDFSKFQFHSPRDLRILTLCRKSRYVIPSQGSRVNCAKNLIFSQWVEILHPDKSWFRMTRIQLRSATNRLWEFTSVYACIGRCVYRIWASSRIQGIFFLTSSPLGNLFFLLAAPKLVLKRSEGAENAAAGTAGEANRGVLAHNHRNENNLYENP